MDSPLVINATGMTLIAAGALLMVWNIAAFVRLVRRHKLFGSPSYKAIRHFAVTPALLMVFFLASYLFVLVAQVRDMHLLGGMIVGLIFFFGAVYVFLTNRFQSKTLGSLLRVRDRLHHDALHDPLTALANRRLLMDRLQQMMLRAERAEQPYAVIFLDADRFKVINDSLGHAEGDKVLKTMARRLEEAVRKVDTVARFGGDEFVLLLDNTAPRRAIQVVRRIRASLKRPVPLNGSSLELTCSFGIASGPMDDTSPDQMLQHANLALHQAKAKGRDRIKMFKGRMLQKAIELMAAENDLRRGLAQQEFELHYQPVVALNPERRLAGFEALLRWNHPKRGLVPPSEFIPLAEETGLIIELGEIVIEQACAALESWREKFPGQDDLRMAVNISPRQFSLPTLNRLLRHATQCCSLEPRSLILEVTESAIMEDTDIAVQRMGQLRDAGFSIAIDDFGTGYSSLAYVRDFPVDHIKIDRSFVARIESDAGTREIVRCMVLMARSLGLGVVAEGVETQGQLDFLADIGCDMIQGYLFSKPEPGPRAERILADGLPHQRGDAFEFASAL